MGKIAQQAAQTESAFGGLQSGIMAAVGVGGILGTAFSLHSAWESTEKYLKTIKEVSELTSATASETDFLFSSARKAGVEYSQMNNIMFRLSKRGAALESSMATANGQHVPGLAKKFQRLGVDMSKGPVQSLASMSDAVKNGKVGADELMQQFQIPRDQVNDFKGFLENLDKAELAGAKKGGPGLVSGDDISDFAKLEDAQHRINDGFNRLRVMVMSKFLPVVAAFAEQFADRIEALVPKAVAMGEWLAKNMDKIVAAAKVFVAVMTAKKLLNTLTMMSSPSGIIGKLASGGLGGGIGGMVSSLKGVFAQFQLISVAFGAALPLLVGIAAAIGLIYLGYKAIEANVGGLKDRITALFNTIAARFELIGEGLSSLFNAVFGGMLEVSSVGELMGLAFEKLVQVFDFTIHVVQTLISFFGELHTQFIEIFGVNWFQEYVTDPFMESMKWLQKGINVVGETVMGLYNKIANSRLAQYLGFRASEAGWSVKDLDLGLLKAPADMFMKHWNKTAEQTERRVKENVKSGERGDDARDKKPAPNNFDFSGSRFDITQNFAEGFDPDRIAVAFSEDLAALGEHKVSSGFNHPFAIGR
jgi:hypothetical protein